MLLTAVIETTCLRLFGYKKFSVLAYFFIINLVSNYLVNILFQKFYYDLPKIALVPMLEISVVIFEILCLGLMTRYTKKMSVSVFFTNLISFLTGVILFGI